MMLPQLSCPPPDLLRELLGGNLPDAEHAALVAHLDGCRTCQQRLDQLAGADDLSASLRRADRITPPPADSAFWSAMSNLRQSGPDTSAPTPLLAPTLPAVPHLSDQAEQPGQIETVGHFEIRGEIGRGGMGIVLRGFDPCLQRPVAIKVLEPRLASNDVARQRFCREARTAARITHEHVVTVYQVDEDEGSGVPYLVMQLVEGESLEDRLLRGRLSIPEVVRIGMQAAAGLAAAHEKALTHRDVKPANILLEKGSDRVKLTDFGLARAAEDVKLTRTGLVAGTPLYMSPEQAQGAAEIDHRSDLFSLGCVLYEMCAGLPAFHGDTPLGVLQRVAQHPHRPVQQLNSDVPDWLAAVIDRLLAKRPDDRFQSAAEVAEVLAHHLSQIAPLSPLQVPALAPGRSGTYRARPAHRAWRWVGLAGALLVVGLLVTEAAGWTGIGRALFARWTAEPAGPAPLEVIDAGSGPVWSVAFAPDGKTLAIALDDGTVRLWDLDNDRVRASLQRRLGPVWSVAFAPRGGLLAAASDDGAVSLYNAEDTSEGPVLTHGNPVRAVAFSPDGKKIVTGSRDGRVRLWDVATGKEPVTTRGHEGVVVAVAFSPDGRAIASAGGDKTVKLWNAQTGQELLSLTGHRGGVYTVAFAPDGQTVASGGWDKTVRLWDVNNGAARAVLEGHSQDVWGIAFHPRGTLLASASEDRTVKVWDIARGRPVATFPGHTGTLYTVAFSADGQRLASAGRDGTVRIWQAP